MARLAGAVPLDSQGLPPAAAALLAQAIGQIPGGPNTVFKAMAAVDRNGDLHSPSAAALLAHALQQQQALVSASGNLRPSPLVLSAPDTSQHSSPAVRNRTSILDSTPALISHVIDLIKMAHLLLPFPNALRRASMAYCCSPLAPTYKDEPPRLQHQPLQPRLLPPQLHPRTLHQSRPRRHHRLSSWSTSKSRSRRAYQPRRRRRRRQQQVAPRRSCRMSPRPHEQMSASPIGAMLRLPRQRRRSRNHVRCRRKYPRWCR